ncbi:hypothetical protein TRFO_15543 [Tritrichomonas foetus]|uniref:Uncharacterized protein n=1 Tax=Tritrichomonas foetus TaxID=1144522 RepID=A0A1J4KRY2_9EUKA|nr:hypothetical protein TRFO_15543 [Tritrichomonas foetus]|eukprot:OHT14049.1 hypothetical protein TRFO_15543 [Tritrichomonas foetus]
MMKNERNISSSSSSDTIKHHLNNVHNIAKAGLDNSSIFTSLSETTRELLLYKEKCVNLQTQLTISNETLSLQAAEFSFQKREYELEIEQLKKIEENLRSQIYKFTTNLSDNDALINLKNEINLYKMKNDELQKKHLKWKKKAKLLLDQSSMEHSKSNDYNVLHSKYIKWKNKAKSFQSSAHENTTQSNLESNNHNNSSKVENLGTIKSHHNSFNLEIEKHHETLPESTFDSKKISFNESKICNLEEEIKKLKEENEDSLKELKNSNKKIEKIEKKYKKWKKRAKNQDFNSSQKNENIVNIEMKYSQLEKELIDQKESNKKLNQALFDNKKVHLEEKHKLESKYIKWKNKNKNSLGKNSQKVEKIKKQYKIIDSKYKKWKGKFKELKSENTKLQEKIGKEKERLKLLVEKYKKLHSRYQILHSQQNSIQNEISNSHNMNNNNNQDNSNNQDSNNNEIDDNSLKNIQKKSDSNDKNICGNEEAD